eukprot:380887-Pleurochrysis_carterae.AAC.1
MTLAHGKYMINYCSLKLPLRHWLSDAVPRGRRRHTCGLYGEGVRKSCACGIERAGIHYRTDLTD